MSKKKKNTIQTVGFVALGCPKNIVDSEKMLADIVQSGFILSGSIDNADVVVINTCGFIEPAKREALDVIREVADLKKNGSVKKIIVTGCLAQRMRAALLEEIPDIDAIIGLNQRDQLGMILKAHASKGPAGRLYFDETREKVPLDSGRLLITPAHSPFLRISEGCDRGCAFCTIPSIRGRFRSKPLAQTLDEARELVEHGAVELTLIAQDSTCYGRDINIDNGLSRLLDALEKIKGLRWIRVMYQNPTGITDALIETFARSEKIVHYIDMPIQHISDAILKAMYRPDTRKKIEGVISRLRQILPDVVLRTTVIVGYPGETEQQFTELLDFIRETRFDALGCFTYYPETGTPAAELSNQVPDEVKKERSEALMLAQQEIAFAKNREMVGRELLCLVDTPAPDDTDVTFARYYGQAPEIDAVCLVCGPAPRPGDFIRVRVTGSDNYDLRAEQI